MRLICFSPPPASAPGSGQSAGLSEPAVSGSVFSPDGVGALIAFERHASGRVIGYVQGYPDGNVVRRPKLP